MVAGRIFGTVQYEKPGATITGNSIELFGVVQTDLTLLTLDVASNRPNPITSVGLNFYTTGEDLVDAGTSFYCWSEQRLTDINARSEEHTSELQSPCNLVCRLLLEKKKIQQDYSYTQQITQAQSPTLSMP